VAARWYGSGMSAPDPYPHDPDARGETGEDGPITDLDLLRNTPLRVREWLLVPLLIAVTGGAVTTALTGLAVQHRLALSGWATLLVAALVVPFAGVLARYGYRAYARVTPVASASFLWFKVAGFSALATVAVLAGVIGASFFLVAIGLWATAAVFGTFRNRSYVENASHPQHSFSRVMRRAILTDGVVLVVASVAAGLMALTGPDLSTHATSQYIADAIVLPVIGVILIVYARTLSRSDENRHKAPTR
jgi:hypothetical protein